MKKMILIVFAGTALFGLTWALPASAALITYGESATYAFDFSAQSPSAPYDGYEILISFTVATPSGFVDTTFDPPFPYSFVGFYWASPDSPTSSGGSVFSLPGGVFQNSYPGVFKLTLTPADADTALDITSVQIRMIDNPVINNFYYTSFLEGTPVASPVPEPSTLLLLGSGLLGLVGYGRKRFKK